MTWFGDIAKFMDVRDVRGGARMPDGYGFSYLQIGTMRYVLYPIPFNIFVRVLILVRNFFWDLFMYPTKIEKIALDSYHHGNEDCHEWYNKHHEMVRKRQEDILWQILKNKFEEQFKGRTIQ